MFGGSAQPTGPADGGVQRSGTSSHFIALCAIRLRTLSGQQHLYPVASLTLMKLTTPSRSILDLRYDATETALSAVPEATQNRNDPVYI